MSFLRVSLFTLISSYLLLHLGFCKAYQNCLVALIKITTVFGQLNKNWNACGFFELFLHICHVCASFQFLNLFFILNEINDTVDVVLM